jgi:hypothetical protein
MLICCIICHGCRDLCYAMLCYAMLCYAMLCYAMLCYAMLCYAMLGAPAMYGHMLKARQKQLGLSRVHVD